MLNVTKTIRFVTCITVNSHQTLTIAILSPLSFTDIYSDAFLETFFFFKVNFMAVSIAHGSSLARHWVRAETATYATVAAMLDPLTQARDRSCISKVTRAIAVRFLTHYAIAGTPTYSIFRWRTQLHRTDSWIYVPLRVVKWWVHQCLSLKTPSVLEISKAACFPVWAKGSLASIRAPW